MENWFLTSVKYLQLLGASVEYIAGTYYYEKDAFRRVRIATPVLLANVVLWPCLRDLWKLLGPLRRLLLLDTLPVPVRLLIELLRRIGQAAVVLLRAAAVVEVAVAVVQGKVAEDDIANFSVNCRTSFRLCAVRSMQ